MNAIINHFLVVDPQSTATWFTLVLTAASLPIALVLRRPSVDGVAFGFLILCGAATFTFVLMRATGAPVWLFGFLAGALALALAMSFRVWIFVKPALRPEFDLVFFLAVIPPLLAIYLTNIIQPDPSAALSALHAWHPLYVEKSFAVGHFLRANELTLGFGGGLVIEVYYLLELIGMVALGGWLGLEETYPAYLAASMLAAMLGFLVLASALCYRRRKTP